MDPVIWQNHPETAIGGFTLETTGLTAGTVLPAGLPIGFDESTRKARIIKVATLHANALNNATVYQVKKGHNFIVGEFPTDKVNGDASAITGINTSNADYDEFTLTTTLGVALTAGTALFQAAGTANDVAVPILEPKGLLYDAVTVGAIADESCSVVVRGTVYHRRISTIPLTIRQKLPLIIFSESY